MLSKQLRFGVFLLLGALGFLSLGSAFQDWGPAGNVPASAPLQSLLASQEKDPKLFVASGTRLFEIPQTETARQQWKTVPGSSGAGPSILHLYSLPDNPETILALTEKKVYRIQPKQNRWENLYAASFQEKLTSLAFSNSGGWYLGTSRGILESRDMGQNWRVFPLFPKNSADFVFISQKQMLAASGNVLFYSDDFFHFREVFRLPCSPREISEEDTESENPSEEEPVPSCSFNEVIASDAWFWAATSLGVYQSFDHGAHWKALSQSGLSSLEIRHLIYARNLKRLFASSEEHLYEYYFREKRWGEISYGPKISAIRGLALSADQKQLYVLTREDLFSYPLIDGVTVSSASANPQQRLILQQFIKMEPSAREIQKAVSRFANTSNWKTRRWHAESRLRALLPNVSFGKDFSWGNNIDIDRGGTGDKDFFIQGPADTSRGWDFDVSWDLADFIFSTSQTSIDSREKLMIELRHDLTSEATRLYFERRRLQMEIILEPAPTELLHFQKLFQIDELTSLLDSLTNGLMSKRLEVLYRQNPEFETLWEYRQNQGTENRVQGTDKEGSNGKNKEL